MALLEYKPTETLFHYTSVDAFANILRSRKLRFSDLRRTNDPRELNLGYDRIFDALTRIRHGKYGGEGGMFLSILMGKLAEIHSSFDVFTCCFSSNSDELPMWKAYGDNGCGITIGFRPRSLFDVKGRIQRARYISDDTDKEIENLILGLAEDIKPVVQGHSHDDGVWADSATELMAVTTAVKHQSWAYEKEVRMNYIQTNKKPQIEYTEQIKNVWEGTEREWLAPNPNENNPEKRFLDFSFGKYSGGAFDASGAIDRVLRGPNCNLSIDQLRKMLIENGFTNFDVLDSDCSFNL